MPDPTIARGPDFGAIVFDIAKDGARVHQLRFARESLEKLIAEMDRYEAPPEWIALANDALGQVKAAQ